MPIESNPNNIIFTQKAANKKNKTKKEASTINPPPTYLEPIRGSMLKPIGGRSLLAEK
jgi:hypothetical protein